VSLLIVVADRCVLDFTDLEPRQAAARVRNVSFSQPAHYWAQFAHACELAQDTQGRTRVPAQLCGQRSREAQYRHGYGYGNSNSNSYREAHRCVFPLMQALLRKQSFCCRSVRKSVCWLHRLLCVQSELGRRLRFAALHTQPQTRQRSVYKCPRRARRLRLAYRRCPIQQRGSLPPSLRL
jgi:hypothetical protein